MGRTLLSAISGAIWLAGAGAALSLVADRGAQGPVLLACAGIGAACLLGSLVLAAVADRRVSRLPPVLPDHILAALPFPAALLASDGGVCAASAGWSAMGKAITVQVPQIPRGHGRFDLRVGQTPYSAHIAVLAGSLRLVVLVRAGAVIPAAALERFAHALLADEDGFRFDAGAVAGVPALAAFNQILAARTRRSSIAPDAAKFTDSQSVGAHAPDRACEPDGTMPPAPAVAPIAAAEHTAGQDWGGDAMDDTEIGLTEQEFMRVRKRVHEVAGIHLSESKRTLVVSRLARIVRAHGLTSFSAYLDRLERLGDPADEQAFINALTTNLTRFFREDHHFEHLRQYVATLLAAPPRRGINGRPRLRIWSAGCSTGQEPFTVALALFDAFPELMRWDFRILATDIDSNVLARAEEALYPASELNGLSPERARLFERTVDGRVRIPARAREIVAFRQLNLIAPSWPFRGPFDAILCRNVAIYFDKPTQGMVFDNLGRVLAPDGYLYIGHSENLGAVSKGYRSVGKTIYQLAEPLPRRDAA